MQSLMKKIIILLALSLSGVSAHAAGYQVEIIIFENLRPATDGEISQTALAYPDYSGSIDLTGDTGTGNPFKLLSPGFYKLGGIYNQLKASGRYRPMLQMAWSQPALYGDNARSVHIIKAASGDTEHTETTPIRIDGTIRVRASQFLHADVDLLYFIDTRQQSAIHAAADAATPAAAQPAYSRLRESRRMKLNELHYFDHPLFGMLMHISRAGSE